MPYTSIVFDAGTILVAAGVGVLGTTLSEGSMPSKPSNIVTVYEFQGKKPTRTSAKTVAAEYGNLKVVARNAVYETGYAKAAAARAALQNYSGTPSGAGSAILEITATSSINSLGQDDNGLFRFSVNFQVTRLPQ